MNKDRRKALQYAIGKMEEASTALAEAKGLVETAKDEEQEYFENMPEAFQQGDKGEAAQAAISELEEAISKMEEAIDNINNAQS